MTTWRKEIQRELDLHGETWSDIESSTLTPEEAGAEFDSGYGGSEGVAFTVWTKNRVYFPAVYDGAEWVGSVSRNPDGKKTPHIGGG